MTKTARLAVQKMLYSRLTAAIAAAALSAPVVASFKAGRAMPYVQIGEAEESDAFRTASTDGSVLTALVHVWAADAVTAAQIADTVLQDQTVRGSLPALDNPFKIITVDVVSAPTVASPRADGQVDYHIPIRLRYQITQTA